MDKELIKSAAKELSKIDVSRTKALLGFDGFVDAIMHVVDKRISAGEYVRLERMADYGARIAQSAGYSCNIEVVTIRQKLGGNGPILANALIGYGMPVTYIGSLGLPSIHPVFEDMAARCEAISIADIAQTDAVEFLDGKVMVGKHQSLDSVNWENISKTVGSERLARLISESALTGFENWTMLSHMSSIWRHILNEVLPLVKPDKSKVMFFDLADPGKRRHEDIREALELIGRFRSHFNVTLGLNEKETVEIAAALGIPAREDLEKRAREIFSRTNLDCLVVHPAKEALAVTKADFQRVSGPYCARPKLTTGAGDNFNGGFLLGLSGGLSLERSLVLGVGASGYYVRNARSPGVRELGSFLEDWASGGLKEEL